MRYTLRTLLIVMLLGGPLCAWGYHWWKAYKIREALRLQMEADAKAAVPVLTIRPGTVNTGFIPATVQPASKDPPDSPND